ncbi:MAG: tetratricopeptide repeat protein [Kiritimatiellia bacterium]
METKLINAGPPQFKEPSAQPVKADPSHQGNDFKRMFGHHIRMGMDGILEDFQPRASIPPDPTYPPPLENNAIIFSGTEYAHAALSETVQITNLQPLLVVLPIRALMETEQMNQIRDTYGERIWLPSVIESSMGFERVIRTRESNEFALENRLDPLKTHLVAYDGNLQVAALFCEDIWKKNRADHTFYVEEGYAQPWMAPYLEPHGLVMRLVPKKRPIPSELLQKDAAFWDWYSAHLLEHPRFANEAVARHAFSKLRVAMAGVFQQRGLLVEAEKAYEQAHALCPSSMEVVLRRSNFYIATARVDKAVQLVQRQLEENPKHALLSETLLGLRELKGTK